MKQEIIILTMEDFMKIPIWKLQALWEQGWSVDYETTATWVMLSNKNQLKLYRGTK